jgi:hypothetical protein
MSARSTHSGVFVGVDGSPSSTMAVRWAAREASETRYFSARIISSSA